MEKVWLCILCRSLAADDCAFAPCPFGAARLQPEHKLTRVLKMTMLVVDDDGLVTTLMSLSLDDLGYHNVVVANTGLQALAHLDAGLVPDVLFCDLQMPGMDGVQLLRHLGSRSFSGGVILVSGSDWRILKACEEMGQSLGLHMLGILQKPFDTDTIQNLLLRAKGTRQTATPPGPPIGAHDLRLALEQGHIEAWFQPQLDVSSGLPVGMEVLARWHHAERGFVSPLSFITLAEECGLIDDVMHVVFNAALAALRTLRTQGIDIRMSVNFSASNLHDPTLPEQIEALVLAAGIKPSDVIVEITESGVTQSQPLAQEILARFRLKGFGLSIDDFGTGYSSMAQLHRLPFTELKIDKAFVHGAASDSRSYAMFESSVLLARKLGVVSVAEGVETDEDFAVAKLLGCDVVQGYLFAKAMPLNAVLAWLADFPLPTALVH
jgi:EAL domain-containing protein (putative c-di-GMP-specific phosphodiesterase class I)/CheY-like chemotaxis protein